MDPKQIPRLSSCDDEIYEKFKADFPDFPLEKVEEDMLKSEENKKVGTMCMCSPLGSIYGTFVN